MKYPVLTKEQITPIISYHADLTFRSFDDGDKAELSDKAKACLRLISSGKFGCNSEPVAELVSIILGEEIVFRSKTETIFPGALVALAERENPPIVLVSSQTKNGDAQGHYASGEKLQNTIHLKHLRAATPQEIEAFFETRHGLRDPDEIDDEMPF